jgi:hypothetical protein
MIIDVIALLEVVLAGAEVIGAAADIIAAIQDALDLLSIVDQPSYADMSLEDKTLVLRRCTKIVANLDLNLSCYPMGYVTTLLYDLDGNPIP